MDWHEPRDRRLVALLRDHPRCEPTRSDARELLERAERHGVGGVVTDLLREFGVPIDPEIERERARYDLARELDHQAHLTMLGRLDGELARRGIDAVALKGVLLAERLYPRPSARVTTDIDLLVREDDLARAHEAVTAVGYSGFDDENERRFRREHHHLHYVHAAAPPLELHFHAYKGFGSVLPAEPVIARRARATASLEAIGVPSCADEIVYLGVHAAAHRFIRLGWLFDLKLLLAQADAADIELAAVRAREWGYERVLGLSARLLEDVLGVSGSKMRPLGPVEGLRETLLDNVVAEPSRPLRRSATRFLYSAALCDSPMAVLRYAIGATTSRARRSVRSGR